MLEKLVRGKSMKQANQFSEVFARQYQENLADAGCLGPDKELLIDKLRIAYQNEKVDMKVLSRAIVDK